MTAEIKKRRRRIATAFSASYIVLLVIPIIVSVIVYVQTVSIVREEVVRNNMLLLEQAKGILDRRMAEIESVVRQVASDPRISSYQFMTKPFEGANTFKTWYTAQHLYDYNTSNNFILDYFVLYKNSNMVLGHKNVYKFEEFNKQVFHYTDMDQSKLNELLFTDKYRDSVLPSNEATYFGKTYPIISYIHPLDGSSSKAAILLLIDSREMVKLLEGFDLSSGGGAYIRDSKGQTIASLSSGDGLAPSMQGMTAKSGVIEPSSSNGNLLTTYTSSESMDWYFVVSQSPDVVLHKVTEIRKIILGLFIALLVILLLYCLFTYHRSKPIRKLLLRIMERTQPAISSSFRPYAMIEQDYSLLEDDKLQLQRALTEQLPLIRNSFLQRLLKGDFSTESELRALKRHAGTELNGLFYATVVIRLQSYEGELTSDILEELDIRKVMVKDVLGLHTFAGWAWYEAEQDNISVIIPLSGSDVEESREQLELLLGILQEQMHIKHSISPVLAVGGIYPALSEVSRSYVEAKQALGWGQREISQKILWHDRLPEQRLAYYYPPDVELRLIHLTKMGALEEVEALLENICQTNERMHLVPDMFKFLHYEMWGTLVKITEDTRQECGEGTVALQLGAFEAHGKDMSTLLQELKETYAQIGKAIHMRKSNRKSGLNEQIMEYIEVNFKRHDFSLRDLADKFNMSESYLSQFFKEQVGINYFDYVESARMKSAKEMLIRTDLPIQEIASQIGYNLSSTFCRAFKRINGVSASNFRRLNT